MAPLILVSIKRLVAIGNFGTRRFLDSLKESHSYIADIGHMAALSA